jgi:hypothetical protein
MDEESRGCLVLASIVMVAGALIGFGLSGTIQGACLGAGLAFLIPILWFVI